MVPGMFLRHREDVKIFHGVEFSYGYNLPRDKWQPSQNYVPVDETRGEIISTKVAPSPIRNVTRTNMTS